MTCFLFHSFGSASLPPLPSHFFCWSSQWHRKKKPKKEVIWTRVCLNQSFSRVERIRCLGCGRTLVLPLNTIQGFLREWPRCLGSIKYFVNLRIFYLGKRSLIILIWQLRTCRAKQKFGRHCETFNIPSYLRRHLGFGPISNSDWIATPFSKEEISYLQKLRHPRLVSFLGFARDAGQVAISCVGSRSLAVP